jgi:molybdenum cofactor synthesis domain-containing protein|tara:strand:+ start:338 stop:1102 length:765 start_codon:yes stop_codon:yes gene_type:complete
MNKNPKNAGVIVIGNEILSGRTQDLNISYIGKRLEGLGIILSEVTIIPDIENDIINKVKVYSERYDYVFTTGGIGPTHDDITTVSIAKAFNVNVVRNKDAANRMEKHYQHSNLSEARLKMADIPEGAILINNHVSGAPAFQINNVFVLAGVPEIMRSMFDSLIEHLVSGPAILTSSVCTNLTESKLANGMSKIQEECQAVSIGSYPFFKQGNLGVNIVLRSTDKDLLLNQHKLIEELVNNLKGKILETHLSDET